MSLLEEAILDLFDLGYTCHEIAVVVNASVYYVYDVIDDFYGY